MEEKKKIFDSINNILIPIKAKFITESKIQATFSSPFNSLNDSSTYISFIDINNPNNSNPPIYNNSEIISGYSSTGEIRAIIKQINFNKFMPSTVTRSYNT